MSKNMVERVARALAVADGKDPNAPAWVVVPGEPYGVCWRDQYANKARAAIEAMRDIDLDALAAGYEAMFEDKWDGTQAPMMGAGWDAMLTAALGHGKPA